MEELKNRLKNLEDHLVQLRLEVTRLTARLETVEAEIYLLRKNDKD